MELSDWQAHVMRRATEPVFIAASPDQATIEELLAEFALDQDPGADIDAVRAGVKVQAERLLRDPYGVVFLLGDDPQGLMTCALRVRQTWRDVWVAETNLVYIRPERRSMRAFCSLAGACISFAKLLGIDTLTFSNSGGMRHAYEAYASHYVMYDLRIH